MERTEQMTRETTRIFGYDFITDTSYEKLADHVMQDAVSGLGPVNFITPNAHGVNMYVKYPELNVFCQASRYVLPDGQPIVWLSRLTDKPIKRRLTGSDFFPVIFSRVKSAGHRCLFVLSRPELAEKLKSEKPDASFFIPEFFEMHELEKIKSVGDQMTTIILANRVNYVFIGISEPKQGALAQYVSTRLIEEGYTSTCIFFFLGASYEFYLGYKKRAPRIFQKTGMEWFYRLITEPKRMYKRYIFGNALFVARALKWFMNRKKDVRD